jgi:predicted PurR-regulated permease PerM
MKLPGGDAGIEVSVGRQTVFWLLAVLAIGGLLWLLSEILFPFVCGMAVAYLLDPVANRLERIGMGRTVAALIIVGLFLLAFVLLLVVVVPFLATQLVALIDNIPGYVQRVQQMLADPSRPWHKLLGESFGGSDKAVGDLVSQGLGWGTTVLKSVWVRGEALLSLFSLVVITPVVAFYLICDWRRVVATVDGWVPLAQRETVRRLAREIDAAVSAVVRGQLAVCAILGLFYAVALALTGLHFGLLIGIISGLISFIPFIGSMTGLVLAVGVAVAQFFPQWSWIIVVLGIFLVGQFIEGYVLQPMLIGQTVGIHPVWLMFAILAFGYVFGFVGLLLAVPLAATVSVMARFVLGRYRESAFYTGVRPS